MLIATAFAVSTLAQFAVTLHAEGLPAVQTEVADVCIELPADHSPRGRVAAEHLLIGELQNRVRRSGGSVEGGRWRVVTGPDQCLVDVSMIVHLMVAGVMGSDGSGVSSGLHPQDDCGLSLGVNAESFVICADTRPSTGRARRVNVVARSDRGLMLAAGRLLRALHVDEETGQVTVPRDLSLAVEPPPFGRMRGHQLTDWGFYMTTEFFEGYVKELLVFGTNQIEFAHIDYARGDQRKLVAWSAICDKYDLRVSLFNPPFSTDEEKAITLQVFANMTRVDSVFHEGGGAETFAAMEAQVDALHKHHPSATAWLSPCGLDEVALDGWLEALDSTATRGWLHGVAYGPGIHISQKQLIERLPRGYALRQYPDISHSLAAMYPQPNWHRIWAFTHGRLVVNPSPQRMASIAKMSQNATYSSRAIGFGAYSEGASDDLNKCIWSALYLEPNTTAEQVVTQYTQHFLGSTTGALLLSGLEKNWDGDGLTNIHVNRTRAAAEQLDASSQGKRPNWRLEAHTFRAFYDAYVQARANWEMQVEKSVLKAVEDAAYSTDGSATVALQLLSQPWHSPEAKIWRAKAFVLAEAVNKSLGGGGHWGGMAVLQSQDPTLGLLTIDTPISNVAWLKSRLRNVSRLPTATMRKAELVTISNWTDAGVGGFYDNLGEVPRSPRLSVGFGPEADPQFLYAPLVSYDEGGAEEAPLTGDDERVEWYWNASVALEYKGLESTARYSIRIVYKKGGDAGKAPPTMTATGIDGKAMLVHGELNVTQTAPYEFSVPYAATKGGSVVLSCHGPLGAGGMGRCCQMVEVWLLKKS